MTYLPEEGQPGKDERIRITTRISPISNPNAPGPFDATYLNTILQFSIINPVNQKQRQTLEAVFSRPLPRNIKWSDVLSLVNAIGEVHEREGSRVVFVVNDVIGHFHRPHPGNETKQYQVKGLKQLFESAGIEP